MRPLIPNLLYLFNRLEEKLLIDWYLPLSMREEFSIAVSHVNFNHASTGMNAEEILKWSEQAPARKVILNASFQTTLKVPHHIHEDGSMEEMPGRVGPFRTYFDGYAIQNLGHAIAICIDKDAQVITTQCPKGYDLPAYAEIILRRRYPDYERATIRMQQQKDHHSCLPLTIYNMLSLAGAKQAKAEIDIIEWRRELLTTLENIEATANPKSWQGAAIGIMHELRDAQKYYACHRRYVECAYR